MSQIEYKKLSSDDLLTALAMNRDFREGFAEESSLRAFLSSPDCWLFAAMLENRIIGFAYGYALQRLNTGRKMLYIHEVGVLDDYQRQGIGTQMLTKLKEACAAEGFCKIFLTCYQNNIVANALYRKAGGQFCAESEGKDTVYWFPID